MIKSLEFFLKINTGIELPNMGSLTDKEGKQEQPTKTVNKKARNRGEFTY